MGGVVRTGHACTLCLRNGQNSAVAATSALTAALEDARRRNAALEARLADVAAAEGLRRVSETQQRADADRLRDQLAAARRHEQVTKETADRLAALGFDPFEARMWDTRNQQAPPHARKPKQKNFK